MVWKARISSYIHGYSTQWDQDRTSKHNALSNLYVYVLPTVPYSVDRIHVFDCFADKFPPHPPNPPLHTPILIWKIPFCKGCTAVFLFFSLFMLLLFCMLLCCFVFIYFIYSRSKVFFSFFAYICTIIAKYIWEKIMSFLW